MKTNARPVNLDVKFAQSESEEGFDSVSDVMKLVNKKVQKDADGEYRAKQALINAPIAAKRAGELAGAIAVDTSHTIARDIQAGVMKTNARPVNLDVAFAQKQDPKAGAGAGAGAGGDDGNTVSAAMKKINKKVQKEADGEYAAKQAAINGPIDAQRAGELAGAVGIDTAHTVTRDIQAGVMKTNARPVNLDVKFVQKDPEDFSADEKEAAQAIINEKNAADLAKNQKTLSDAIKANIKSKQDHIDSIRSLTSDEVAVI